MAFSLQYFDEVEADVQEAKIWYKEQKAGLELEFSAEIEKAIEKIVKTPKSYSVRY
jgi:hypothetical protein